MVYGLTNIQGYFAAVQTKRRELRDFEVDYKLLRDCIAGQRAVKLAGTKYLPMPDPDNDSEENLKRYQAYKARALFYNATQRTLNGLVGEVYSRDPIQNVPTGLKPLMKDADGTGLTLTQVSKRATRYALSMGRAGLLADYPSIEGTTKADIENGKVQPTITVYDALRIRNWRVKKYMGKTYIVLVVLDEYYDDEYYNNQAYFGYYEDQFTVARKRQQRVLRLNEAGIYTTEIYRDGAQFSGPVTPTDANGNFFTEIPFVFIGSENNDADIDHPPMLDLAQVNIAHYRNSADYEEGVYMTGQPTPVFAGLTEDWVKNVMEGQVRLGSRGGVMLPVGGSATLMVMNANSAASEAMERKERQMVALGAKLVEQNSVQRTATEVSIDNSSETSALIDVANNVSAAILFALQKCAIFTGDNPDSIEYQLNTDFRLARMSSQERQQLMAEWQAGGISFSEYREVLRKSGVATLDDDEARQEIDEDADDLPMGNENFDPGDPNPGDNEDDSE